MPASRKILEHSQPADRYGRNGGIGVDVKDDDALVFPERNRAITWNGAGGRATAKGRQQGKGYAVSASCREGFPHTDILARR